MARNLHLRDDSHQAVDDCLPEGAVMARAFVSKNSVLWLAGLAILVLGFVVAAVVLPATSKTPGSDVPNIQVPKMQNVPPAAAPKMRLDTEKPGASE